MKLSAKLASIGIAGIITLSVTNQIGAAGSVTATKDDCSTAWAILMVSHPTIHGGFQHPAYEEAIMSVVKNRPHWTPTGYEPFVSQKFDLQKFDTRFNEGGTAYVAHCGHGATCNELAREVLKAYPEVGSPVVMCTIDPPHILENPAAF